MHELTNIELESILLLFNTPQNKWNSETYAKCNQVIEKIKLILQQRKQVDELKEHLKPENFKKFFNGEI